MPRTGYTDAEKAAMGQFNVIPNFTANTFTLFNRKNNIVVEDAITVDQLGNVKFKDTKTEALLEELVQNPSGLTENINDDGSYTLFFQDKFNKRYTLGEIYFNLVESQAQNMTFWFGERAVEFLDYGLDEHIIDDHITIDSENNIINVDDDSWKNHWHTVPCMQVVVPDYIEGKYASISSKICFKVKTNEPVITGFRIFDATAGLELTRVMHVTERNNGDFNLYTVPLHYQGPLPDTRKEEDSNFTGITYEDVANLEYKEGVEEGVEVANNIQNYEVVPYTKHIIRLQWITCDLATEIDDSGKVVGDFGRFIDPEGQTSLDVVVYDEEIDESDITQIGGVIDTTVLDFNQTKYTQEYEFVPSGLDENYSISFTPNKNVRVKLEEKRVNGFTISWDKYVEGLKIDWSVVYRLDQEDKENEIDIDRLTDPNRALNHHLFPSLEFTTDFCKELEIDEGYRYIISNFDRTVLTDTTITVSPSAYTPGTPCCEQCEDEEVDVKFSLVAGQEDPFGCGTVHVITDDFGKTAYAENKSDFRLLGEFVSESNKCTTKFIRTNVETQLLFHCLVDFDKKLNEGWGVSAFTKYYYEAPEPETITEPFTDEVLEECDEPSSSSSSSSVSSDSSVSS
jgi:hypothetical protein